MNLPHQVKFTRLITASTHSENEWCETHVGRKHVDWARTIVHISHHRHEYTWRYSFNSAEHATSFALVWC
jgi:hypothetical protein